MHVEAQVSIRASRSAVWAAITDIENAARIISGIEKIEVIDRSPTGLAGLRWNETRILFGEPATVEKWITGASENTSYSTRAESDGFIFLTTMEISEAGDGTVTLRSSHDSRPQGLSALIKSIPMVLFFGGVLRKAILKDLTDIKAAVEHR